MTNVEDWVRERMVVLHQHWPGGGQMRKRRMKRRRRGCSTHRRESVVDMALPGAVRWHMCK